MWLGNARGTDFGLKHKSLKSSDNQFWDFSWHEIGFYDLPAMIDYMLLKTNSSKLFFAGHSQGTTSFAVMCSMHPQYHKKIMQAHFMAPAILMKHVAHPLLKLFRHELEVKSHLLSWDFNLKNQICRLTALGYSILSDLMIFTWTRQLKR